MKAPELHKISEYLDGVRGDACDFIRTVPIKTRETKEGLIAPTTSWGELSEEQEIAQLNLLRSWRRVKGWVEEVVGALPQSKLEAIANDISRIDDLLNTQPGVWGLSSNGIDNASEMSAKFQSLIDAVDLMINAKKARRDSFAEESGS